MDAAILHGARDLRVEQVPDAAVEAADDAVVRVLHAGICGSDLHPYRGRYGTVPGRRLGHEAVGVVEDVGADVTRVRRGDHVLLPFVAACGTCPHCRRGEYASCEAGQLFGTPGLPGAQAEAVRVPFADATLWPIPGPLRDPALLPSVLLLGDVAGTGEHAARLGRVAPGDAVAVVGDGAVGLCAVLAARRREPEVLVAIGHHADRLALARDFGADVVVDGRDVHVVDEVRDAIGRLPDVVLETVGGDQAPLDLAFALVRDHGRVASVGVVGPTEVLPAEDLFRRNLRYAAGVAPTRAYVDELAGLVTDGRFDPSPVITDRLPLAEVPEGYRRMDAREALKVVLAP